MNEIELIKSHKFADNDFRAAAIATGCRLWECGTDEEKLARVRLYRDWRTSKIFGKLTAPCFEKACAGVALPLEPMFSEFVEGHTHRCKCAFEKLPDFDATIERVCNPETVNMADANEQFTGDV